MSTIASLAVSITARTSGLTKGLKSARRSVNGFARDLQRSGATAVGFAGSLLAAAGVAGVGALVRSQMEAIDSTAKLADRLNIGTESLVAYRYIAELAGSSSEGLSKGIEKLTKSIGDAATGASKNLEPAFRALGTTSQELARMAPDRAFERVAQGIAKIENPAVRAAVVTKLFGRQGQALTNTLIEIAEKGEDARRRTEKFGLAFSRVDAAGVERANDAMRDLWFVIEGIATQVAVQLADTITGVSTKLAEMADAGGGAGKTIQSALGGALLYSAKLADMIKLLEGSWYLFEAAVASVAAGVLQTAVMVARGWAMMIEKVTFGTVKYDENANNPLVALADRASELAAGSWKKAYSALEEYANGAAAKKALTFMDDVKKRADAAGESARKAVAPQTQFPNLAAPPKRFSEFLQIDLARTALGGGGGRQDSALVRQLERTNLTLSEIKAWLLWAPRSGRLAAVAI